MRAKFLTVEEGDYTWVRRRNYSDPCDNGLELNPYYRCIWIHTYTHIYIHIYTQKHI